MDSVNLYQRLRSRAKTENQLSSCLNKLEDVLDPQEILDIVRWTKQNPAPAPISNREKQWRRANTRLRMRIPKFSLYERQQSCFSQSVYIRKEIQTKTGLLVCFAGRMNRPMMPAWMFLACLPETVTHVMIIRGRWYNELRESTYARDAYKILGRITKLKEDLEPTQLWFMGTSGGALPALIFSQKFNPNRVLLCGMGSLDDSTWGEDFKIKSENDNSSIWFVYGSQDASPKSLLAKFLSDFQSAKVLKVPFAQHAVLANLFFRSQLNRFFRKAFKTQ